MFFGDVLKFLIVFTITTLAYTFSQSRTLPSLNPTSLTSFFCRMFFGDVLKFLIVFTITTLAYTFAMYSMMQQSHADSEDISNPNTRHPTPYV